MKIKLKKVPKKIKVVFRKPDGSSVVIPDAEIKKDKGTIELKLNEYQKQFVKNADVQAYDMTGSIPTIIETGENETGDKG